MEGALAKAAEALSRNDASDLFRVIDQRSRHALASIVDSRQLAAQTIRKDYPAAQREAALSALGDAVSARDAADLFRMRCDAACQADLSAAVGAPTQVREVGGELVVETSRGHELRLFRGSDTWYGIVFRTEALLRERDRAAAELELVRRNAALYRAQGALEPASP